MNTLKTSFLVRKNKIKKNGKAPIYLRIVVDNYRNEISTKKDVEPELWCTQKQRAKGNTPQVNALNSYLDQMQRKALEAETRLLIEGGEVTVSGIKDKIIGKIKPKQDLIQYFKDHLDKMDELIGNGYAKNTYKRYRSCFKHLNNYVQKEYKTEKYYLDDLDLAFIQGFEHYLKTKETPCNHNSTLKYIDHLKRVVNSAIDKEIIGKNPFSRYKVKYEETDPEYLTFPELKKIQQKEILIDRVDRVRDVFLFCCYTGLAYVDVEKLSKADIQEDATSDKWLVIKRQKTKEPAYILLLETPLAILEKYENDPETRNGNLLPVISNQKTNSYLKEIAALCGINKNLTFHMARHTFATTVTLENGVPMDTVQKILGHKDARSTLHYARVTKKKVKDEMKKLRGIL